MPQPSASLPAAILPLALLAGCAAAPSAPPRSTIALPEAPSSADPTPSQWWRLYNEPDLDALVAEALTDNRDLQATKARLLEARAVLREAEGNRLPDTALSAGAGRGSTLQDQIEAASRQSSHVRTGSRFDLGADLTWELDLFGQIDASIQAESADSEAEAALLDAARVAIAAQVVRGWVDACGLSRRMAIAREDEALAARNRQILETLRDAGAVTEGQVAEAAADEARTHTVRPALEARRHEALEALAVLTGRVPSDVPAAAEACTHLPEFASAPPQLDGRALLNRRPDVLAAELRLKASTARIGVAVGDLYPHIAFGAGIVSSAKTPGDLGLRNNMVWRLGPLLSWSFPNVSAARARIAQARARERGELARFDAAILTALQEASAAASALDAAARTRDARRLAAERSDKAAELMRANRAAGGADALEALAAERGALSDRAALAEANLDFAAAQVTLFRALGGGWEGAPDPAAAPLIRSPLLTTPRSPS
ncbi:NodT family efflux transporter outer membrane factor (OMF) lipoprotein [Novosphingobium sp. PhB165]|uniref:efflux transporter outer membrane subunit n=1 Tax=Novosphingobium sp. PhB165 TaxID=2485105 RepID=UPI0010CF6EA7|nr:TolC family protein [Novosphingobium sp. PhB165]TCM20670.1 NodT family efflux transporter outer membrane factor (OMF) lipoprotein [Novosphingobium sp. PhB165]